MEQQIILRQMCQTELSRADINAICKNRGFSSRIASSSSLLEGSYLSSTGVSQVMEGLSHEEVILLHYLKYQSDPVNISAFGSIYGVEQTGFMNRTFNQRYKDVFNNVKQKLIRKGILLYAEDKIIFRGNTKLERTIFVFPKEFHSFLPSIFNTSFFNPVLGENNTSDLKQVLINDLKYDPANDFSQEKSPQFSIQDGQLLFESSPFSMTLVRKRQIQEWRKSVEKPQRNKYSSAPAIPVVSAVNHALSYLEEQHWISPEQLKPVLKVFCGSKSRGKTDTICQQGWKHGCLNRSVVKGQTVYRPAQTQSEPGRTFSADNYQKLNSRHQTLVDPEKISLEELETLSRISILEVDGNMLACSPNIIKMGREMEMLTGQELFEWFINNIHAYKKAAQTIRKRMGRTIVHKNLMVARIRDVTLRVAIQKAFGASADVVFLNDDFIAFPQDIKDEICQVVQKSGHVIKYITA